ncbi:hypothetical protein SRHO_G00211950 [Serrasalmus rhombeus]
MVYAGVAGQGFFEREKRGIEHHVQVGSIGWRPKPRPLNLKFFCMQRIEPIDSKTRSPLALTRFTSQCGLLKLASPQSTLSNSVSQKAKQIFLERIFTLEDATDEAPESVVTAVCEILRDHSVDLLDRAGRKLGPKL